MHLSVQQVPAVDRARKRSASRLGASRNFERRLLGSFVLAVVTSCLLGACFDHDAEVDRVGGPLPNYDAGALTEASADAAVESDAETCVLPAPSTDNARIPCAVDAVLEAKCRRCHTDPTVNGAPFPLLKWETLFEPYGTRVVYEAMVGALESDFMPLCAEGKCGTFDPPVAALTAEEKETLLNWLDCPLPEIGGACGD